MKKILIWYLIVSYTIAAQKALVIVPVADLVGQPLASFYADPHNTWQHYHQLPWAGLGTGHTYACPRLHQALLHEVVDLIETRGQEARIRLSNIFYQTHTNSNPHGDYWTLRNNIATLDDLKANKEMFPTPIDYTCPHSLCSQKIITLIQPYYDKTTHQLLSVGTRFAQASRQKYNDKVLVYIYHPTQRMFETTYLPKKYTYCYQSHAPETKITEFISLLKTWTQSIGTIPYVWGGCSITTPHTHNIFSEKKGVYKNQPITQIIRPTNQTVKTGVDCSGLIARAAQIVGIPYFFKNSYTITKQLAPLKPHETLQAGDIMWLAGHVMIISGPNTLIEARHYDHGYGKIHEIQLSQQFKGIASTTDLEKAFFQNQPLARLDSKGNLTQTYTQFKLLKLMSVWK